MFSVGYRQPFRSTLLDKWGARLVMAPCPKVLFQAGYSRLLSKLEVINSRAAILRLNSSSLFYEKTNFSLYFKYFLVKFKVLFELLKFRHYT